MAKVKHYGNYLVRNKFSYCFRIKVPSDLQKYLGKKELRYSLRIRYMVQPKRELLFFL